MMKNKSLEAFRKLTPKNNIFAYTQGIMDLGATACSVREPECQSCPVMKICNSALKL